VRQAGIHPNGHDDTRGAALSGPAPVFYPGLGIDAAAPVTSIFATALGTTFSLAGVYNNKSLDAAVDGDAGWLEKSAIHNAWAHAVATPQRGRGQQRHGCTMCTTPIAVSGDGQRGGDGMSSKQHHNKLQAIHHILVL
jgi:hypothetical protein